MLAAQVSLSRKKLATLAEAHADDICDGATPANGRRAASLSLCILEVQALQSLPNAGKRLYAASPVERRLAFHGAESNCISTRTPREHGVQIRGHQALTECII